VFHTIINSVLSLNTIFSRLIAALIVADNVMLADVFDISDEKLLFQT
jgi:hypothetical protein